MIVTTLDTGGSLNVGDILGIVGSATTDTSAQQSCDSGKPSLFDPLAFTLENSSTREGSKFRDIRDFVTVLTKDDTTGSMGVKRDQFGTVKMGHIEISLRENKVPLEKLNLAQYMEGSLRILRSMVVDDNITMGQAMEYVNYLIKFSMLAQEFQLAIITELRPGI